MTAWTITCNGTEKSIADWGLSGCRRVSDAQNLGEFTFTQHAEKFDGDPLFPFESLIIVKRDVQLDAVGAPVPNTGTKWFQGYVMEPERSAQGESENLSYRVKSPWYWMDRVFQQDWQTYDPGTQSVVPQPRSHLLIGYQMNSMRLSARQTIASLLDYVLNLQPGIFSYDISSLPNDLLLPVYEANDITNIEAVNIVLRWFPDCVRWFDYSTTPPTLHFTREVDLDTVDQTIPDRLRNPLAVQITSRPDLRTEAVIINYEIANSVNGQTFTRLAADKWPTNATGNEFRAIIMTVNLQGFSATYQEANVVTSDIQANDPDQSVRLAWWQNHLAWLYGTDLQSVTIDNVVSTTSLPRELMPDGAQIADWMEVDTEKGTITAQCHFVKKDGQKGVKNIEVSITATYAITKLYTQLDFQDVGEEVPTGLAKSFYDSTNTPIYQGRITLKEQELTSAIGVGKRVNLFGGRAAWETMAATVWNVTEDIDGGETSIQFGPAETLDVRDRIALLQANRWRFIKTSPQAMTSGKLGNSNTITVPTSVPMQNGNGGITKFEDFLVMPENAIAQSEAPPSTNVPGTFQLFAKDAEGYLIKARWVHGCSKDAFGNKVEVKMLVLAGPPIPL